MEGFSLSSAPPRRTLTRRQLRDLAARVRGERPLLGLAARDGLEHRDVAAVAEELLGAFEECRDVRGGEVGVERLARGPALDERQAAGVVAALVQGVQDAPVLVVRRL